MGFSATEITAGESRTETHAGTADSKKSRRLRAPAAKDLYLQPPSQDADLNERREAAFFKSIALRNGTHKTTYSRRLDAVNEMALPLLPEARPLEVMDVAVSSGVSTLEWMEALTAAGVDFRMTAGDLSARAYLLSFGPVLHILVDGSGYPLQFDLGGYAIPYPPGRRKALLLPLLLAFRAVLPGIFARRFANWAKDTVEPATRRGSLSCHRIALVSPRLQQHPELTVVDDDILHNTSVRARFDVIRAANILNRNYFDEPTLKAMAANLRVRLRPGGVFIVCRTDEQRRNHGSVFALNADNRFELRGRIGDGSEIERLVLDLRA